jgi:hypothetical protein
MPSMLHRRELQLWDIGVDYHLVIMLRYVDIRNCYIKNPDIPIDIWKIEVYAMLSKGIKNEAA